VISTAREYPSSQKIFHLTVFVKVLLHWLPVYVSEPLLFHVSPHAAVATCRDKEKATTPSVA
jgi:hypothetical protein